MAIIGQVAGRKAQGGKVFDWDIEPYEDRRKELLYRAVKVPSGTGRYHTKYQAMRLAGNLRTGRDVDFAASKWRNVVKHVERHRNDKLIVKK